MGYALCLSFFTTESNLTGLYDYESILQFTCVLLNQLEYRLRQGRTFISGETDKDDSSRSGMTGEYQPPKILILGYEDAILLVSLFNQISVYRTLHVLADGKDIVTAVPQSTDNGKITTFIRHEAQFAHAVCRMIVSWARVLAA